MEVEEIKTINPDNYIGKDVDVVQAIYMETQYGPALKVISEVIPLVEGDSLPDDKVLTASKIFGLSKNAAGEIVIAKDGFLHNFLQAKNIDPKDMPKYEENLEVKKLLGIKCKVQKNKKGYLDIA